MMKSYKLPFSELNLQSGDILSEIGYGTVDPDNYVVDLVEELLTILEKEVVAEYLFAVFPSSVYDSVIETGNEIFNAGKTICSLLKGSTSMAVFAATAGQEFERIMNQMKEEGDIMKTYLLDLIGSCIAEKAGEILEQRLDAEIGALKHTHRFSPGYCGWYLTEQKKIFRLLGENPCGITLSEVCLMNPIKSISGVIGIGEQVKQKTYACNICELESCYKRKQRQKHEQQYEELDT